MRRLVFVLLFSLFCADPSFAQLMRFHSGGALAWSLPYVSTYGADVSGGTDASFAVNSCLAAAGVGGVCYVDAGAKLYIAGNIPIPAHTTLDCLQNLPDSSDAPTSAYGTNPAIRLNPTYVIYANGPSAAIRNCLIYRAGMTFPATDSSAFSGMALWDDGNINFNVTNSVIIGFDTAIWMQGARPYINKVYVDGTGVSRAVIEIDTGNTDSGYVREVKIQPLAQPPVRTCAGSTRPGTGLRMGGSGGPGAYLDDIVSQDFQTAQYDFEGGGINLIGKIWADNINGVISCTYSGYGVIVGASTSIAANEIQISQQANGMLLLGNGALSSIASLQITNTYNSGSGVRLGDGSHSGNLTVGSAQIVNGGNEAIFWAHANSFFNAGTLIIANMPGHPYLLTATGVGVSIDAQGGGFNAQTIIDDAGHTIFNPFDGTSGFFAGSTPISSWPTGGIAQLYSP